MTEANIIPLPKEGFQYMWARLKVLKTDEIDFERVDQLIEDGFSIVPRSRHPEKLTREMEKHTGRLADAILSENACHILMEAPIGKPFEIESKITYVGPA